MSPKTIINIVQAQTKADLTQKIIDFISQGITEGAIYIEKSIFAAIRSNMGYEITLWDEDKKDMYKMLQKLDPKQYKKYCTQERDDDFEMYTPLKRNISYVIQLKKLNTYILVSTRCWDETVTSPYASSDEIHIFIFGAKSLEVNNLFLSVINPQKVKISLKTEKKPKVSFYSVDVSSEKKSATLDYCGSDYVKTIEQIFTDKDTINSLVDYINKWIYTEELFRDKGISHKLGVLLYGPPGTGKTSLVKAIAGYFDLKLFTLNIGDFCKAAVDRLKDYNPDEPYILLLEDIDYIFGQREEATTSEEKSNANLLLQFLDGAQSPKNVIIFATTNYYSSLDPAIVREGRFNYKIEMTDIDKTAAKQMIEDLNLSPVAFPEENLTYPVNPAFLQASIIKHVFDNLESIKLDDDEEENNE